MAESLLASLLRYSNAGSEPTEDGTYPVRSGPSIPPPRNRREVEDQLRGAQSAGRLPATSVARDVPSLTGHEDYAVAQPGPEPFDPVNAAFAAFDPAGLASIAPRQTQNMPVATLTGNEQNLRYPVSDSIPRPGSNEQMAGAMFTPWGAVMRGTQTAAGVIPRVVQRAPAPAAATTAAAAVTAAPGEATPPQNPTAGPQQPSLMAEFLRTMGLGKPDDQRPLTQDEYLQARRRLQPKAESDFIESEIAKVRETDKWQNAGKALRENLEAAARNNAREVFAGHQRSSELETRTLANEYNNVYRPGWERQRTEQLSKPFVERHPTAATAMTIGGPVAAGVVTHGVANRVNRGLERTGQAAIDAALANNPRATAAHALRAQNQLESAPWKVYGTAGKMALLPAELRVAGDMIDRSALPPSAPARQDAERRMGDLGSYLTHLGQDVVSGGVGSGTGLGTANLRRSASGRDTARTGASYIRGLDAERLSPDEMAAVVAQRATAATRAGNDLRSAGQIGPGAAGDNAGSRRSLLSRMLRSGQASGASGQTPPAPPATLSQSAPAPAGALTQPPPTLGLPPPAGASSSRSPLSSMLRSEGAANMNRPTTRGLPRGYAEDDRLRGPGVRGPDGRIARRPPADDPDAAD